MAQIYDPAENRNLYGGGGKTMTASTWGDFRKLRFVLSQRSLKCGSRMGANLFRTSCFGTSNLDGHL